MEDEVKRKVGRPRKNIIENTTPENTANAGSMNAAFSEAVAVIEEKPKAEPVQEKRFLPYLGPDSLPTPAPGKTYGAARFFVHNGIELISIRKKRIIAKRTVEEKQIIDGKEEIIEKEIRGEGLIISRELFLNLNSKISKKSGIKAELKKCGIPGIF